MTPRPQRGYVHNTVMLWITLLLVVVLTGCWLAWQLPASDAPLEHTKITQQRGVALAELPAQARDIYIRIHQGGPFAYDKDGTIFFNRERLLPVKPRGYYREYTVAPPNAASRGARRIVCGGTPHTPDACWYTANHYQTFVLILPPQRAVHSSAMQHMETANRAGDMAATHNPD